MIYIIQLEPIEERYTEQWARWFPEAIKERGAECTVIEGESLADEIITGAFLDINSTLHYKAEQLKKIAKLFFEGKIKDGDKFLVTDIEFWGIESIRYLADLNNIKVEMYGFCHAASYTREDFMSKCEPYAKYFEQGWFKVFDKIFVGSLYHKNQILLNNRCAEADKIVVTGNPYSIKEVKNLVGGYEKKNRVILTNRPDYEKRPNLTLNVFEVLKKKHPEWEFMVTTGRKKWGKGWIRDIALNMQERGVITLKEGITKKEYLTYLAESKVMTGNSIEENFGYCILEAMIFDTTPVLPNAYSHPELLLGRPELLFDTIDQQVTIIEVAMKAQYDLSWYAERYEGALAKILNECGI